ncbi:hypothetical protein DU002_15435 [Corallincola holothuriorum]|uniref:Calcineurin-like phosphoesterase domain-containing protein n=1 Tax=Corallincola holothuriorum TaxID=2282215 RepID=A0A368N860_9GAMM|nr:metallophosphoesterase [Corallincola holothuriorum]RCU45449.1 hypothetical protein DU002_15435 [Corallincola holothuriorum]
MQRWQHLFCLALLLFSQGAFSEKHRYPMPGTLYVLGDVHGAYQELSTLLQGAKLIDEDERWIGGTSYLVSVGDLLDRGDDSRWVMDLLRRLEKEARDAGGRVYVLMGNHEQMNLMGELNYVTPGEFASYIELETSQLRNQRFEQFTQLHPDIESTATLMEKFEQHYQPGYLGHRAAMALDGDYGKWLIRRPTLLVIGRLGFVHGGLSSVIAGLSSGAINEMTQTNIRQFVTAQQNLLEQGHDLTGYSWFERLEQAKLLATESSDAQIQKQAQLVYKAGNNPLLNNEGPLWYRGNVICHPLFEQPMLKERLANLNIEQLIVGHTPTPSREITAYLGGLVIDVDTGMNTAYYRGKPALLKITDDAQMQVFTDGRWQSWRAESAPDGYKGRRYEDWEQLLTSAEITEMEAVGEGVTQPQKVTLSANGETFHAIFKTEDVRPRRRNQHHQLSDSFRFDIAAYQLARAMALTEIPPTVERTIKGKSGALQLWVNNTFNESKRLKEGLYPAESCVLSYQHSLMNLFDILIHNDDRTRANMLYQRSNWKLWWIDHSRAFRTLPRAPEYLAQAKLIYSPLVRQQLQLLSRKKLQQVLGRWLDSDQLRAITKRRDLLLRAWKDQR